MTERLITEATIKQLVAGNAGNRITDDRVPGFVARLLPSGKVTFGYQYSDKRTGARRWITIGLYGAIPVAIARARAVELAGLVATGHDPAAEAKTETARSENTVDHVLDEWLEKKVSDRRTIHVIKQTLANHVRPALGGKVIYDLKRAAIIKVFDELAVKYPRQAQIAFAYLRTAFKWWAVRDEDFNNPIVPGIVNEKQSSRDRVLTPEEIADIWRGLDEIEHVPETFPAFVKVLFLTACRRCEVSDMHTRELEASGKVTAIGGNALAWTVPAERYKTKIPHLVPIVPAVQKLLPKRKDGFVFGCASHKHNQAAGAAPLAGFDKSKVELDRAIARIRRRDGRPEMPAWTFHDLRRTARTMLAELGVSDAVGEAVLGHVKRGVLGTYNRYNHYPEKVEALTALAGHVDNIVGRFHAATPAAANQARRG